MNEKRFQKFQQAIDDRFLEEATEFIPKRKRYLPMAGLAACFCLLVTGLFMWSPWQQSLPGQAEDPMTQIVNPVRESSFAELILLGYRMEVPAQAQNVGYTTVSVGDNYAAPMAQVSYQIDTTDYTYRALQTTQTEDISGQYETWVYDLSWTQGDIQLRLCSNEEESWVGWYVPDVQTQWCLSAQTDAQTLLNNALDIARDLGFDFATAPAEAENVTIQVMEQNGLTVAQTEFQYEGICYTYRTAASADLEIIDISGQDGVYISKGEAKVSYCNAQLLLTGDGRGKLLWMDFVPGLAYSLSTEDSVSAESLIALANQLFVPIQGDAE